MKLSHETPWRSVLGHMDTWRLRRKERSELCMSSFKPISPAINKMQTCAVEWSLPLMLEAISPVQGEQMKIVRRQLSVTEVL